ncbi:GH3 auxin-responsive promoter family protein, partial [bacterium]|nr:GH3 auxin-responsive promoter family protein [bacterium]
MGVKLAVIKRIYSIRMRQIEDRYRDPWQEQERTFRKLMTQGSRTSFGKEMGLEKDISLEEYRRRIPPKSYEFFSHYIARMVKGESSVLWPGKVRFFSLSSGTTAEYGNKYIPFTEGLWQNNRQASLDNLLFHVQRSNGDFGIFEGQMLFLGGTTNLFREMPGVYAGDLSAILTKRIPFFFKGQYLPGDKIAQIENWEKKIELIAAQVQGRDVRLISGIPSWLLVLFEAIREVYGNPAATLKEMFPEFRLLISGGVNVTPYEELFARVSGQGVDFAESYPSSEAFIAIQD